MQIKEWRIKNGITQKELAEVSGLGLRWIQKVESGEISIENITVKKFVQLMKGIYVISEYHECESVFEVTRDAYSCMSSLLEEVR